MGESWIKPVGEFSYKVIKLVSGPLIKHYMAGPRPFWIKLDVKFWAKHIAKSEKKVKLSRKVRVFRSASENYQNNRL